MSFSSFQALSLYAAAVGYVIALLFLILKRETLTQAVFSLSFWLHTFSQTARGWRIGIFLPNAVFEGVYFLPWCLSLILVAARFRHLDRNNVNSLLFPICLFTLIAVLYPKGIVPPSPVSGTVFAALFFFFEGLAQACFVAGGWFGFLYLYKGKTAGKIFERFLIWGFVLYSTAQATGAVWSYLGWANGFMWNQRHMQSASLWCWYAALLHMRFRPAWTAEKRAWLAVAGFLLFFAFNVGTSLNEIKMPRI